LQALFQTIASPLDFTQENTHHATFRALAAVLSIRRFETQPSRKQSGICRRSFAMRSEQNTGSARVAGEAHHGIRIGEGKISELRFS
jgi:hypothetical protein